MRYARNALVYAVVMVAFGVFLPWQKGLDFFDPVLLAAYACMGILFAGPAAAQAFQTRPESMSQALRWISAAVGFGEAIALAMLVLGLATVRLTHKLLLFGPDVELLLYALAFGFAASVALAALAAWVAVRFSSGASRTVIRVVYLSLLGAFFLKSRWLPAIAATGAVISAGSAVVFLFLLRAGLKRASEHA